MSHAKKYRREEKEIWSERHNQIVDLFWEKQINETKLRDLLYDMRESINAFHMWRGTSMNLLFHAVEDGCLLGFDILLQCGANPTLRNNKGTTVLHLLMKRNWNTWADLTLNNVRIEQKSKYINSVNNNSWSVLMTASSAGSLEGVEWLLRNGAIINLQMRSGWTALHAAVKNNQHDVVKLLLKRGANKDLKAFHTDFGHDLTARDVTMDDAMIDIIDECV